MKVQDVPQARREWLMRHVAEREELRVRWQHVMFKTAVTFLSICAPLTVTAIVVLKASGVVTVLLKGSVAMAVLSVLSGLVVMRADLHTKSRFVSNAIALLQKSGREIFAKYLWYEVGCIYVMVGAFVASVLLLLAAVLCI